MRGLAAIALLILSNLFMTFAWYGHLQYGRWEVFKRFGLPAIVLASWGIALFEYCFQVPANRIGYSAYGGPFNLWQLKVIQEVVTLVVFTVFTTLLFKGEHLRWNHLTGFFFLVVAVYFLFRE